MGLLKGHIQDWLEEYGYDLGYDGNLFGGITHTLALYTDLITSDGKKYQK